MGSIITRGFYRRLVGCCQIFTIHVHLSSIYPPFCHLELYLLNRNWLAGSISRAHVINVTKKKANISLKCCASSIFKLRKLFITLFHLVHLFLEYNTKDFIFIIYISDVYTHIPINIYTMCVFFNVLDSCVSH